MGPIPRYKVLSLVLMFSYICIHVMYIYVRTPKPPDWMIKFQLCLVLGSRAWRRFKNLEKGPEPGEGPRTERRAQNQEKGLKPGEGTSIRAQNLVKGPETDTVSEPGEGPKT